MPISFPMLSFLPHRKISSLWPVAFVRVRGDRTHIRSIPIIYLRNKNVPKRDGIGPQREGPESVRAGTHCNRSHQLPSSARKITVEHHKQKYTNSNASSPPVRSLSPILFLTTGKINRNPFHCSDGRGSDGKVCSHNSKQSQQKNWNGTSHAFNGLYHFSTKNFLTHHNGPTLVEQKRGLGWESITAFTAFRAGLGDVVGNVTSKLRIFSLNFRGWKARESARPAPSNTHSGEMKSNKTRVHTKLRFDGKWRCGSAGGGGGWCEIFDWVWKGWSAGDDSGGTWRKLDFS